MSDGSCQNKPGSKGFTYFEPGVQNGYGRQGFNVSVLEMEIL